LNYSTSAQIFNTKRTALPGSPGYFSDFTRLAARISHLTLAPGLLVSIARLFQQSRIKRNLTEDTQMATKKTKKSSAKKLKKVPLKNVQNLTVKGLKGWVS
jgi:hypothetical protein